VIQNRWLIPWLLGALALGACGGARSAGSADTDGAFEDDSLTTPARSTSTPQVSSGSAAPVQVPEQAATPGLLPQPVTAEPTAPAPAPTTPVPATPLPPAALSVVECPSYDAGFVPLVYDPVCSNCHATRGGLPRFEPFAQAEGSCRQIGQEVASRSMPPNGALSAEQLEVVANWVALGCPETQDEAATLCAAEPPGGSVTPTPGAGDDEDDDDRDEDEDDSDDDDDSDEDGDEDDDDADDGDDDDADDD
jgi:hypothetical protein